MSRMHTKVPRTILHKRPTLGGTKESNKEHFVNLCESNNFESHTPSSLIPLNATNSELARTLFPVESTKRHKN